MRTSLRASVCLVLFLLSSLFFHITPIMAPSEPVEPSTVGSVGDIIYISETLDYVRLNYTMFTVEFYKGASGYNKIFRHDGSVLVYDDRLVLQYWTGNQWKQRGVPIGISWVKLSDYHYRVTRQYTDYLGTIYHVTYDVKSDADMKITIELYSAQSDEYRLYWCPSGITEDAYEQQGNRLVFGLELERDWIGFDWQDVYESFGDITEWTCESVAQGRKANIYFDIGTVDAGETVIIDPSTVGEARYYGTPYIFQRKGFYATGRFWVFYYGTISEGCGFKSSTDGSSWSSFTQLTTTYHSGTKLSVWYNGTYVSYICYTSYRMGTPNSNGTITWAAAKTDLSELGSGDDYQFISVDSNGYPWIAYKDSSDGNKPKVIKSQWNNGSWSTATGYPITLSTSALAPAGIVPLDSGKMYVIYGGNDVTFYGKLYDGSWGSQESIDTNYRIRNTGLVADGDDVHVVFYDGGGVKHWKRTYGSGWGYVATVWITSTFSTLAIDKSTSNLYAIRESSGALDNIYYKRYDGSSWGDETLLADDTNLYVSEFDDTINCFYQMYSSRIGVFYSKGMGTHYVRFAYLMSTAPTITSFSTPASVYANEWFSLTAEVTDGDGTADLVNATVELTGDIILKWDASSDTFSKPQDPDKYCDLDASSSERTTVDATTYTLKWVICLSNDCPEGSKDIIGTHTLVYDTAGTNGTNSQSGLFTFQHAPSQEEEKGGPGPSRPPSEPPVEPTPPVTPAPLPTEEPTVNLVLLGGGIFGFIIVVSAVTQKRKRGLSRSRRSWKSSRRKQRNPQFPKSKPKKVKRKKREKDWGWERK